MKIQMYVEYHISQIVDWWKPLNEERQKLGSEADDSTQIYN